MDDHRRKIGIILHDTLNVRKINVTDDTGPVCLDALAFNFSIMDSGDGYNVFALDESPIVTEFKFNQRDITEDGTCNLSFKKGIKMESGTIKITPSAVGAVTSKQITFKNKYDKIPNVTVTPSTIYPNSVSASYSSATTEGCIIHLSKNDLYETTISYQVMGT